MSMFDTPTRSELMAEFDAEELRAERRAREADPGPEEPRSCLRCGDSGEVHWNPSHIGDPQLEQSAPCPRCDGSATEPGTGASTVIRQALRDRLGQFRASDAPNVTSTTLAISLETPRHRANLRADTAAAFEREYFKRGLDKPAKRRAMLLPPDQGLIRQAREAVEAA